MNKTRAGHTCNICRSLHEHVPPSGPCAEPIDVTYWLSALPELLASTRVWPTHLTKLAQLAPAERFARDALAHADEKSTTFRYAMRVYKHVTTARARIARAIHIAHVRTRRKGQSNESKRAARNENAWDNWT